MILRLEGVIKGDDEWVVACCKDLLLRQRPLDLVPFDHFLLAQDCILSACVCFHTQDNHQTFHGKKPGGFLFPDQIYLSDISLPDQLDLVEAARSDLDVLDLDGIRAVCSPKGD